MTAVRWGDSRGIPIEGGHKPSHVEGLPFIIWGTTVILESPYVIILEIPFFLFGVESPLSCIHFLSLHSHPHFGLRTNSRSSWRKDI